MPQVLKVEYVKALNFKYEITIELWSEGKEKITPLA